MAKYDSAGAGPLAFPGGALDSGSLSNAQGSNGITAGPGGSVIGNPVVSNPFDSAQVPANLPTSTVYAGDSVSTSDGMAAHASGIDGTSDAGPYMDTGAGSGRVAGPANPNANG